MLAATFLAHVKVRFLPPADPLAFEGLLLQHWESARAKWPTVALSAEPFVTHLAERLPEARPPSPVEPLLEQLSLAELYLACACTRGMASALELFDRHYLSKLPGLLRGHKLPTATLDDVCQQVRVKLLVPTPEGGPKISEYTGRGALLSWVRVTGVRAAIKHQLGEKPAPEEDSGDIDLPTEDNTELELIKRRHQVEFRQAVREAFATLSDEDRHRLRLYFVDQLSMYELAALFRVNQSTISRWLKTTRQTIYEETQRRLEKRLGLSHRDFKSFLATLESRMHMSQLLSEETKQEDGEPRS
ncbi:MAG TPA: sigma-70 family RNA polymerase sigma factor [Archangium sp.]|uniref:sigma-70 family RNA polymerase sigma factor n=1 Tax=Archangium sp. TaxID=1872627 RepID=UPI002E327042|nr:sigma-70 family RNA polymerase sigma factor [Archangium sp.]HEX5746630.1 sigma-70 family RNA polymerase sigma factor [Archangium sp.]